MCERADGCIRTAVNELLLSGGDAEQIPEQLLLLVFRSRRCFKGFLPDLGASVGSVEQLSADPCGPITERHGVCLRLPVTFSSCFPFQAELPVLPVQKYKVISLHQEGASTVVCVTQVQNKQECKTEPLI